MKFLRGYASAKHIMNLRMLQPRNPAKAASISIFAAGVGGVAVLGVEFALLSRLPDAQAVVVDDRQPGGSLVICGGGDSALDWTVALCEKARSLTLLHRRAEFRAAPATVARMRQLVGAGKMQVLEGHASGLRKDNDMLVGLDVRTADGLYRFFGRNHYGSVVGLSAHLFVDGVDAAAREAELKAWLDGVYA